ncbi:glycosyltransferase family 4 protein [Oceanospirillum sanctuarii]|uniref:glycosyltransferase family 4 protein n=1 Tax=Oceanospirillum sanctuarii TaxID=1434821 RepID=UPI00159326C7|nr:glycosyltransferase family 4 protein [Oceanospirillum sanctuarii]
MKKIAYLTTAFPVLSETFIGNEIRAMRALGHEIVLASFERPEGPAQPDDLKLAEELVLLKDIPVAKVIWQLSSNPGRLQSAMSFINQQKGLPRRSLLWYAARMAALVEQTGCQHIHAHFGLASAATAIAAARLAGVSVSFTCHGYDIYRSPADLPAKLQAADFAVAVCDEMQQDMRNLMPTADIRRIRCGIDPQQFSSQTPNLYNQNRLLYLGRLSETKGVDVLLHALANIPARERPKLDIVGDGPLKLELLIRMIRLDLVGFVHFLGAKPQHWFAENHHHYTALAAPFVVTPQGVKDTGPLVIKEALALKLPVITSDIQACREMLTDTFGQTLPVGDLVKSGDKFALAASILKLTQLPPAELKQMGEQGREHLLANFKISDQAKQLSLAISSCREEISYAELES